MARRGVTAAEYRQKLEAFAKSLESAFTEELDFWPSALPTKNRRPLVSRQYEQIQVSARYASYLLFGTDEDKAVSATSTDNEFFHGLTRAITKWEAYWRKESRLPDEEMSGPFAEFFAPVAERLTFPSSNGLESLGFFVLALQAARDQPGVTAGRTLNKIPMDTWRKAKRVSPGPLETLPAGFTEAELVRFMEFRFQRRIEEVLRAAWMLKNPYAPHEQPRYIPEVLESLAKELRACTSRFEKDFLVSPKFKTEKKDRDIRNLYRCHMFGRSKADLAKEQGLRYSRVSRALRDVKSEIESAFSNHNTLAGAEGKWHNVAHEPWFRDIADWHRVWWS